jgi:beta-glucosidase
MGAIVLRTFAKKSDEVSELELKNAALARRAAAQGIVLLKNDGALPVAKGSIALYGEGAQYTIKGGTGSGEVNSRHAVSIREGLEQAGFMISNIKWLDDYQSSYEEGKRRYRSEMRKRSGFINFHSIPYITAHPFSPPAGRLIVDSDIACGIDTCFYIIVRQAGETADRSPEPGDFALSHTEIANISKCTRHYSNTIVVINAGGMIDLRPLDGTGVKGIIFFCQQGNQGGHALADIISGKVTPSGHLAATWPMAYADIPFGRDYGFQGGNNDDEDYREGIYVGYRYFDTFDKEPRYEFGYGLSYTTFSLRSDASLDKATVNIKTAVTNTGLYLGKTVVQAYVSCPAGKLDKEYQRLAGFAKTEMLEPNETQEMIITFNMDSLASYDPSHSRFILEAGDYVIRVGESSRNTQPRCCAAGGQCRPVGA